MTKISYIAKVPYVSNGIPCLIGVTYYFAKSSDCYADNPDDYYGYVEREWELLDRKGYRAAWLEKKGIDEDAVNCAIDEYMEEEADSYAD